MRDKNKTLVRDKYKPLEELGERELKEGRRRKREAGERETERGKAQG